MSAQFDLCRRVHERVAHTQRVGLALLATLLLSACASANPPPEAAQAANRDARVASTGYSPVLGAYSSRRPVEPQPWREQNDRLAPQR